MEIPVEQLNMQSSTDTVESWDSLRQMNLILALEEEFSLAFTDEEIVDMQSVEIVVETLKNRV